jgi:hypothetical protein
MQVPATTEQTQAPKTQKLAKNRRISPRIVHAVELIDLREPEERGQSPTQRIAGPDIKTQVIDNAE